MKPSNIILIAGPTASGKSNFAQDLALQINGEIINADSQQFYRSLNIGTGKVLPADQKVPHHLFDICEVGESMTAMAFSELADKIIRDLFSKNKTPIVVGGTGLYLRALLEGLDRLPSRSEKVRKKLEQEIEAQGSQSLHQKLKQIDPESAEKVSHADVSRLIRYLELYELTRQAPSQLMKHGRATQLRYPTHTYWFRPDREEIRNKIAHRVKKMMEAGWVKEVQALIKQGKDPKTWPNKPIGYLEIAEWLFPSPLGGEGQGEGEDEKSLEQVIQKIITKTQQYAKRQDTFFRGLFKNPAYQQKGSILEIKSDSIY